MGKLELPEDQEYQTKMGQEIQEAKLLAITEIQEYFDDLIFMSMKEQPCQMLKNAMLKSIGLKLAEMEEQSSPAAMARYVSYAQETKCKAEELAQHQEASEAKKAQLMVNPLVI